MERHYELLAKNSIEGVLPLVIDLSNPSPALGWHNAERPSFIDSCKVDTVMALALIHHLCIGNNVSLDMAARFFAELGNSLILEFAPKEDSQVQRLLATREDVFPEYDLEHLLAAFSRYYECRDVVAIPEAVRTLILLEKKLEI